MSHHHQQPNDPTVNALVQAINDGDRPGFYDLLAPDAVLTDDGIERDVKDWVDKEIFNVGGRFDIQRTEPDGSMLVRFTNGRWGEMDTRWRFITRDGKVDRIETGQA
ncbi:nuclear transport factor 2 family protein [Actinomadura hibisca]|uniref:nuclear transport factor 2 family protein n=1 Tax=Actinomadura hibisca TaxID=68565 RepID=UPI000836F4B8|nr:nuclear transport factor 2 family protein [Actinomadura hibisca]